MYRFRLTSLVVVFAAMASAVPAALASPLLQLDIQNATYVTATDGGTTEATTHNFTLYAFLTPPAGTTTAQLNAMLNDTYYIAAAISPQVSTAQDLGAFSFGSSFVRATQDMVYGDPPFERYLGGAASDTGDLATHNIYNTYFKEFSFKFQSAQRATTYDVVTEGNGSQNNGPTAQSNGGMYYMAFTVDTWHLNPNYKIHFDLYNETLKSGNDLDINKYAPFTYDAQSRYGSGAPLPEPTSLLLLGTGLGGVAAGLQRKRRRGSNL